MRFSREKSLLTYLFGKSRMKLYSANAESENEEYKHEEITGFRTGINDDYMGFG